MSGGVTPLPTPMQPAVSAWHPVACHTVSLRREIADEMEQQQERQDVE